MRKLLAPNRSITGLLLLMLLSFAGNAIRIELFLGVYFFFSSIFVLMAVFYFGTKKAVMVALFASLYGLFDPSYSFSGMLLVLEAAVAGLFYHRVKKSLLAAELLFLAVVAGPFLLAADLAFFDFSWPNAWIDFLKQTVNGLLNVMLANAFIIGISFFSPVKKTMSLQTIFFHLFMLFFFVPLIIFVVYISKEELQSIEKTAEAELNKTASSLSMQLNNLYHGYVTPLTAIADRLREDTPENIQRKLAFTQQANPSFKILAVTDESGKAILRRSRYALRNETVYLHTMKKQPGGFFSNLPPGSKAPLLTVAVPVLENGKVQSYVAGAVSPVVFLKAIQETAGSKVNVTLLDRQNKVIVSNQSNQTIGQPFAESSSQTKISSLQKWSESSYSQTVSAGGALSWSFFVSIPASEWEQQLQQTYIRLFYLALVSAALALLASYRLSIWLQYSFSSVAAAAHNFPDKIRRQETINWPDVRIAEVNSIVESFQTAEDRLHHLFADVRRSEQKFEYLAHYDPLTNAYSRTYFLKHFQELMNKSGESSKMALFFIDLDRFKIVNDLFGHQAGDSLLIEVGQRLKDVVSEKCLIARLGGDEFLVLMLDAQQNEASQTAKALIKALSQPYHIWGSRHHLTASIGISLYPRDGSVSETLIKHADMAMYEAKNKGKDNYQFYSAAMKDKMVEKAQLESELRQALERHEMMVYYQPQIDLQTGVITGVEALVRWQHPRLGFVSPALFVPIAEETGLIVEMGEQVLQTACRDAKAWQNAGQAPINVSVNVSMKQLLHESLLPSVEAALKESGLSASYLKLEITESMAMLQPQQVIEKLQELKQLGIQLALDDFGTGYSSLNYLKMLPIHILKIDRAFVKDIDQDSNDLVIVKALVEVAHSLGMIVIAEGVETEQQQRILTSISCDQLQGFVFSKPLPGEDITKLLAREAKTTAANPH